MRGAHQRWPDWSTSYMCDLIVCEAHSSLSGSRIGVVELRCRKSSLQREAHSGAAVFRSVAAKRFELSTRPREKVSETFHRT